MRILVILRQVYEQKSIHWDYEINDFRNRKLAINKADLHALQWAADFSEQYTAPIDIMILTEENRNDSLKEILTGFPVESCIQIQKSNSEQMDASHLTSYIGQEAYDLIVCGDETEDEHNTSLLPLLGYSLGMEVLCSVNQIETIDSARLRVHRKEERGAMQIFEIKMPTALSLTSHISKLKHRRKRKKEMDIVIKERTLEPAGLNRRLGAPDPKIIFGSVPQEENPLKRLMNVMGFSSNNDAGLSQQTQALSDEHLHFTAERLMKWLKE